MGGEGLAQVAALPCGCGSSWAESTQARCDAKEGGDIGVLDARAILQVSRLLASHSYHILRPSDPLVGDFFF